MDPPDQRGRAGGEVGVDGAAPGAVEDPIRPERDHLHLGRARQRCQDQLGGPGGDAGALGPFRAAREVGARRLPPGVVDDQGVSGLHEIERHGPAHPAEPDESDAHGSLHSGRGEPRPVVPEEYSMT